MTAIVPVVQTPPITYVAYVSSPHGKCVYQTGDVPFDRAGFASDLKTRFDPANAMLIYHPPRVRTACLKRAIAVAKRLGFKRVGAEIAPGDLELGPPRTTP